MPIKKNVDVAEKLAQVELEKDSVLIFRATKPLTEAEHEQLSKKLRAESKKSGFNCVLAPYSTEVQLNGGTND